jgi:ubiquinol-cytochrome c reductase cytochrome b subunit
MFASILLLFFLPWLDTSPVRSASYRPLYRIFFWILIADIAILGWAGGSHATPTVVVVSQIASAYYFAHFLIIVPLIAKFERPLPLPNSITESVLHGEQQEAAPAGSPKRPGSIATGVAD